MSMSFPFEVRPVSQPYSQRANEGGRDTDMFICGEMFARADVWKVQE